MALFESKNEHALDKNGLIPAHIAIIMDGNGRWAKKRMMPRVYGHKEGMNTLKKIAIHAQDLGVKVLTLYAFSTENWKRPNDEVSFLMNLPIDFFDVFMPELIENKIKVTTIGWIDELPEKTKKIVQNAVERTKDHEGMILNFAFNYGSRQEMTEAIKNVAEKVQRKELSAEDVTEELVSQEMFTGFLNEYQDPDLVIRTSGEIRISNFLLWQIAYSELYFTDEYWPDFSPKSLDQAIATYQHRNRRFGGI
ncbi:isoprenyl transferase [Jeotgalibaca caeni]|uniref:isoprenyl transferase n=1 Tax=Jeotgalibaca caeni TaxID=3028623 RepID=UPI00237E17C7|nr:isoprenyl transferase [Jeotgalibaca caeni]MDE1548773.1 isoprenyl transferase [Jeotgalibaca caeni]